MPAAGWWSLTGAPGADTLGKPHPPMKPFVHPRLAASLVILSCALPACSLVTVPVKTVGGVVETTVEAPFKAVSGGYRSDAGEGGSKKKRDRGDDED